MPFVPVKAIMGLLVLLIIYKVMLSVRLCQYREKKRLPASKDKIHFDNCTPLPVNLVKETKCQLQTAIANMSAPAISQPFSLVVFHQHGRKQRSVTNPQ